MQKFSIIIPVYNVEKYIGKCIESILCQTYVHYEVCIVDDGSTDNTGKVADEYAKQYPNRIYVIHKKHEGQGMARNVAIKQAKGKYLLFIDGDDCLADTYVLEWIASMCNGEDIVSFNWVNVRSRESTYGNTNQVGANELQFLLQTYYSGMDYLKDALQYNSLYEWYIWRYAIRREYWIEGNFEFISDRKYEDVKLVYKILENAGIVIVLNKVCYVYRTERSGSTCAIVSRQKLLDVLYVMSENIKEILRDNRFDTELKKYLCNNFSCLYYSCLIESSRFDRVEQKKLWDALKRHKWVCEYTTEPRQKLVRKMMHLIGIPAMSKLLGFRRKVQIWRGEKNDIS